MCARLNRIVSVITSLYCLVLPQDNRPRIPTGQRCVDKLPRWGAVLHFQVHTLMLGPLMRRPAGRLDGLKVLEWCSHFARASVFDGQRAAGKSPRAAGTDLLKTFLSEILMTWRVL